MNKKILGIKVGTILTVLGCVATAIAVWILAKYQPSAFANATSFFLEV